MSGGMAWPAVGVVGGGEASAAAQPATGGRSRRHDRCCFGQLEQEDQRLKKHDVTVGCQSNGRRVSSISDLLAPAAKAALAGPPAPTSRGRLCCRAGLSAPYYSHHWPGIPVLTHTPCYSAATAASHRSEPVNPRTPLCVGIHCRVFSGSVSSPS